MKIQKYVFYRDKFLENFKMTLYYVKFSALQFCGRNIFDWGVEKFEKVDFSISPNLGSEFKAS